MQSKARTPASRDAIIYFRNGERQKSITSVESERPLWLIELEAIEPSPSMANEPVIYFRKDGTGRRYRTSVGAKHSVRKKQGS